MRSYSENLKNIYRTCLITRVRQKIRYLDGLTAFTPLNASGTLVLVEIRGKTYPVVYSMTGGQPPYPLVGFKSSGIRQVCAGFGDYTAIIYYDAFEVMRVAMVRVGHSVQVVCADVIPDTVTSRESTNVIWNSTNSKKFLVTGNFGDIMYGISDEEEVQLIAEEWFKQQPKHRLSIPYAFNGSTVFTYQSTSSGVHLASLFYHWREDSGRAKVQQSTYGDIVPIPNVSDFVFVNANGFIFTHSLRENAPKVRHARCLTSVRFIKRARASAQGHVAGLEERHVYIFHPKFNKLRGTIANVIHRPFCAKVHALIALKRVGIPRDVRGMIVKYVESGYE